MASTSNELIVDAARPHSLKPKGNDKCRSWLSLRSSFAFSICIFLCICRFFIYVLYFFLYLSWLLLWSFALVCLLLVFLHLFLHCFFVLSLALGIWDLIFGIWHLALGIWHLTWGPPPLRSFTIYFVTLTRLTTSQCICVSEWMHWLGEWGAILIETMRVCLLVVLSLILFGPVCLVDS